MIGVLAIADWDRWKVASVSRQKKDALFELACRIALLAEEVRANGEAKTLAKAAEAERRKCLRFGLEILAGGADAEALDQAFEAEPSMTALEKQWEPKRSDTSVSGAAELLMIRDSLAYIGCCIYSKDRAKTLSER